MAFLGPLISAGVSLLGNALSQDEADERGREQLQLSQIPNITSPLGNVSRANNGDISLGLTPDLQSDLFGLRNARLGQFAQFQDPEFIQNEVDRLRGIARPREDALRASLRSQVFNRGRLGLGVGGGASGSGAFFNPELAALEEGLARADMGRIDQARQEQQRFFGNALGLLGAENALRRLPLGAANVALQARATGPGLAGVNAANQRSMDANDAFFATLGNSIGGLFGGGSSTSAPAGSASSLFGRLGF